MPLHYGFHRNRRVFVVLRSGEQFVARWHSWDGRVFRFVDHEPLRGRKSRTITYYNAAMPNAIINRKS